MPTTPTARPTDHGFTCPTCGQWRVAQLPCATCDPDGLRAAVAADPYGMDAVIEWLAQLEDPQLHALVSDRAAEVRFQRERREAEAAAHRAAIARLHGRRPPELIGAAVALALPWLLSAVGTVTAVLGDGWAPFCVVGGANPTIATVACLLAVLAVAAAWRMLAREAWGRPALTLLGLAQLLSSWSTILAVLQWGYPWRAAIPQLVALGAMALLGLVLAYLPRSTTCLRLFGPVPHQRPAGQPVKSQR